MQLRGSIAAPGPFGDRRQRRIGLLGGSFNPAHAGHQYVAEAAMKALGLDAVWLLVSPGNPLKSRNGMAPFPERLASAQLMADGVHVIATDIELKLGYRRTERTLAKLRRRFPAVRFVFIIGADNLWQLPSWGAWRRLAANTPLAVLPRPAWTRKSLHGRAASVLRHHRCKPRRLLLPPASGKAGWTLIPAREVALSSTAIRDAETLKREQASSVVTDPPLLTTTQAL